MSPVRPESFVLAGGLDTETAHTTRPAGLVMAAFNYESSAETGYERLGGYERFDGRPRPSDASYVVLAASAGYSGVTVGDTVNGQTSGATGKVIALRSSNTQLVVTRVTGSFTLDENIRVVTTVVGVYTSGGSGITGFVDNELSALAAAEYRTSIAAVPGSGAMRGIAVLAGTVYAFRDNAGGTALAIYKSTAGGWVNVPLMREVSFTAGSVAPTEGGAVAKGGAGAIVRRIVLTSGDWSTADAAGKLVIDTVVGSFSAGAFTSGITATCSGADSAISLLPGGRVETVLYNFTGSTDTERLYGCDGVNKGWEFDGTTLVPISTGMTTDTPRHVSAHRGHLFFAFRGSVQHSGIGKPYQWTIITGAAEIATGQDVTGFSTLPGDVNSAPLMISSETRTMVLYGTSSADWKPTTFSDRIGAQRYSIQNIGNPITYSSTLGITPVVQSQAFGNFEQPPSSERVRRTVMGKIVTASVVNRTLLRMRLFFSDGSAISVTPLGNRLAFMPIDYGFTVRVAVDATIDGTNRVFIAGDDGYVYECDRGRSFDGDSFQWALRLGFSSQRSLTMKKRYRSFDTEVRLQSPVTLRSQFEFAFGATDVGATPVNTQSIAGGGATWDVSAYDASYYDAPSVTLARFRLTGVGTSISAILAGESDNELPHLLQASTVRFTPLREDRG